MYSKIKQQVRFKLAIAFEGENPGGSHFLHTWGQSVYELIVSLLKHTRRKQSLCGVNMTNVGASAGAGWGRSPPLGSKLAQCRPAVQNPIASLLPTYCFGFARGTFEMLIIGALLWFSNLIKWRHYIIFFLNVITSTKKCDV